MKNGAKFLIASSVTILLLSLIAGFAVISIIVLRNLAEARMLAAAAQLFGSFEDAIAEGRLEEAYELCSQDFKRKTSLEKFRKLVARWPALRRPHLLDGPSSSSSEIKADPGCARVLGQTSLTNIKGNVTYTVILVRAESVWTVDDFQVKE